MRKLHWGTSDEKNRKDTRPAEPHGARDRYRDNRREREREREMDRVCCDMCVNNKISKKEEFV